MKRILHSLWEGWKQIAYAIGRVNATIVFTFIYVAVFGLYSLFAKLFRHLAARQKTAAWREKPYREPTLETMKRQF